jgi:hypothetical protein
VADLKQTKQQESVKVRAGHVAMVTATASKGGGMDEVAAYESGLQAGGWRVG